MVWWGNDIHYGEGKDSPFCNVYSSWTDMCDVAELLLH
jgi:hypothetical protein